MWRRLIDTKLFPRSHCPRKPRYSSSSVGVFKKAATQATINVYTAGMPSPTRRNFSSPLRRHTASPFPLRSSRPGTRHILSLYKRGSPLQLMRPTRSCVGRPASTARGAKAWSTASACAQHAKTDSLLKPPRPCRRLQGGRARRLASGPSLLSSPVVVDGRVIGLPILATALAPRRSETTSGSSLARRSFWKMRTSCSKFEPKIGSGIAWVPAQGCCLGG